MDLPELEHRCTACNGRGGANSEITGNWCRCPCCDGAGYEPTEFGKRILDLMRHNFRTMAEDELDD